MPLSVASPARWSWPTPTLGAAALWLLAGCSEAPAAHPLVPPRAPCRVQALTVGAPAKRQTVAVAGIAVPLRQSTPAVALLARVLEADLVEGSRVEAGQVLVRLDVRDLGGRQRVTRAGGQAARRALAVATEHLRRTRVLFEQGALVRPQLEAAELAVAQAEAAAQSVSASDDELGRAVDSATIRAPFAGQVVRKLTEVGNLAAPGQPLFVLEDDHQLRVVAPIGAPLGGHLTPGSSVEVEAAGERLTGTVESVLPSGDPRAPGLRAQVLIDNAEHRFRAGTVMVLQVPVGEEEPGPVTVPRSALVHRGRLEGVYVVAAGTAERRWLALGSSPGESVEVLSGLKAGERVIDRADEACVADGRRVEEASP